MEEIWKDIPNFKGYLVSNLGNIYSCKRNKILSQHHNSKGYLRVTLCQNGKNRVMRVNRLVAEAFIPNPDNLPEVNHEDGNKENNRVDNLKWCDHTYNMQEAFRLKLIPPRKANSGSYKPVRVNQYDLNGNLLNTFNSMSEASRITGYSVTSIHRYCNNKRKCEKYIWRYADK